MSDKNYLTETYYMKANHQKHLEKKEETILGKIHNVFIIDIRCDENQNNKNGKFGQQQTSFFFI